MGPEFDLPVGIYLRPCPEIQPFLHPLTNFHRQKAPGDLKTEFYLHYLANSKVSLLVLSVEGGGISVASVELSENRSVSVVAQHKASFVLQVKVELYAVKANSNDS